MSHYNHNSHVPPSQNYSMKVECENEFIISDLNLQLTSSTQFLTQLSVRGG